MERHLHARLTPTQYLTNLSDAKPRKFVQHDGITLGTGEIRNSIPNRVPQRFVQSRVLDTMFSGHEPQEAFIGSMTASSPVAASLLDGYRAGDRKEPGRKRTSSLKLADRAGDTQKDLLDNLGCVMARLRSQPCKPPNRVDVPVVECFECGVVTAGGSGCQLPIVVGHRDLLRH
jgi:hypothetical protein